MRWRCTGNASAVYLVMWRRCTRGRLLFTIFSSKVVCGGKRFPYVEPKLLQGARGAQFEHRILSVQFGMCLLGVEQWKGTRSGTDMP